jgi:hypothetical protein
MGALCGCEEPGFQSVTVILPSGDKAEPDPLAV